MKRTVGQIIDQVLATLPDEHKHDFDKILESIKYAAPETLYSIWLGNFCVRFNEIVPPQPTEDWHIEAISALTNISIDEVKEKFNYISQK